MPYIQKTNPDPDPLKFGTDPDPGLYSLKRTSDTKNMKNLDNTEGTFKKASSQDIQKDSV